jgi:hypothetical protein
LGYKPILPGIIGTGDLGRLRKKVPEIVHVPFVQDYGIGRNSVAMVGTGDIAFYGLPERGPVLGLDSLSCGFVFNLLSA